MQYLQEITLDVALGLASWKEERHIVAKQDDNNTRFLKITLLADGQPLKAEADYTAMFRCLKPDGYSCLNSGTVNEDGTVTVELSNQVLATPGTVKADVSLMKDDAVLSTVTFNIQVEPAPVSADTVTSTDEFGLLEELADEAANAKTAAEDAQHKAETAEQNAKTAQGAAEAAQGKAEEAQSAAETARDNANSAAKLSESWAVGGTDTREGEDQSNSKYYAEQSGTSAGQSAASAAESADKAAEAAASAAEAKASAGNFTVDQTYNGESTNAQSGTAVAQGLATKAASSHTHAQTDITGLDTALAGKAAASHTHTTADISDLTEKLGGYALASAVAELTTKVAALENLESRLASLEAHAILDTNA